MVVSAVDVAVAVAVSAAVAVAEAAVVSVVVAVPAADADKVSFATSTTPIIPKHQNSPNTPTILNNNH